MAAIMAFGCCACSKKTARQIQTSINNNNNQVIEDEIYYDYADNVEYYVFCTGDDCLVNTPGQTGWVLTHNGIPTDLIISDGEFAHITAEVTYVSGGVAGYINSPMLTDIHSQQIVKADEVIQAGSIAEYNPDESFYGIKRYTDGTNYFLLVCAGYENFRLYRNGAFMDEYSTTFDAEAAMGIREKTDTDAEMEHYGNLQIYVFCCNGRYFIYTGNICFNEKGIWKEFLNEEFGNVPLDFTLEDGEVVHMEKAELMRVNGGEGNYVDAPMYLGSDGMEKVDMERLIDAMNMDHWEESPTTKQFESRQYGVDDAMIFHMDGKYYVYPGKGTSTVQPGVYDTVKEVDEALGR